MTWLLIHFPLSSQAIDKRNRVYRNNGKTIKTWFTELQSSCRTEHTGKSRLKTRPQYSRYQIKWNKLSWFNPYTIQSYNFNWEEGNINLIRPLIIAPKNTTSQQQGSNRHKATKTSARQTRINDKVSRKIQWPLPYWQSFHDLVTRCQTEQIGHSSFETVYFGNVYRR